MLTQTAKYALRALIYLTQQPDDNYHQTREVARLIHVPANYLGKTLQKLARARIVDSQKGLHGGFRIAKLPEQIRLYDILNAIDSIPRDMDAEAHPSGQQVELGSLYERFAGVGRIYVKFLQDTSLADLMHSEGIPVRKGLTTAREVKEDTDKGHRDLPVLSI
jgi:Rrf2 family protein